MKHPDLRTEALKLANADAEAEATISKIFWFPHPEQIRLVEVDFEAIPSKDPEIRPFYFQPVEGVPFPSGVALIPPTEAGRKPLPREWNADWSKAHVVFEREDSSR